MKYFLILLPVLILMACSREESSPADVAVDDSATQAESPETAATDTADQAPQFEIEQVVGNVYRGRSGRHYTVFMVTSEGTILADPISVEFATWLKGQLAERFDSTVRYVLYSHHHWDHASGGAVFQDTATLVGHENMIPALALPLPANYAAADANGDGAVQRDEAGGGLLLNFDKVDADGDGSITGAEINVDVVPPGVTYADSHVIYLGGKEAQMHYTGVNHSNDGSIIYFPEEAVAFGADWLNVKGFPRTLYGTGPFDWAKSAELLVSLSPTRIVPGHGEIGYREDAEAYAQYFKDLYDATDAAAEEGLSLEEFMASLPLEAYADWPGYDSTMLDNAREAYIMETQ